MAMKEIEVQSVLGETGFNYVSDDVLYTNAPVEDVMLESETAEDAATELAKLTQLKPGSTASLPDYSKIWRKKADGTWASII